MLGAVERQDIDAVRSALSHLSKPDEPLNRAYIDCIERAADAETATPAVVLNDFFRNWGHLLIYDSETLGSLLKIAGFEQIRSCPLQQSDDPRLANLENDKRMPDGLLALHTMIFEALKPDKPRA